MRKSKTIYTFTIERRAGVVLIAAREYPYCVLQVVTTTPADFARTLERCRARGGFVATHDTDRTFMIIHLGSGDHDGRHPDQHITIDSQKEADRYCEALADAMAQAVTWYHANVIEATL